MSGPGEADGAYGLTVTALGIHWVHEPGYTVDRPHGMGEYVLLRFYTPMLVQTAAGFVHGEPNDCLLYSPSFPQWFSGRNVGHADDFVHFDGPEVPELIARYRVPLNTPFRCREVDFIPELIAALSRELHGRELFWQHSAGMLLESLLLRLGRLTNEGESSDITPADLAQADILRSIRRQVHERLQEPWTAASMARLSNLSVSRFSVLYRKFFEVSPIEDLIAARLARARVLLANTALSVGEAAEEAGFRNACYFSRLFRRRFGIAPRDYYHRAPGTEESENTVRAESPAEPTPRTPSEAAPPVTTHRGSRRRARRTAS
ncbi:MAG: AraC family transcriptional regulator [Armatimonadetes bacterium]|nr:AraC family transcriptional regulator [Armatimonadota bacterium]